ncbi:aspartate/glutamate racemase family protein [Rhodococcus sp. NPDC003348]
MSRILVINPNSSQTMTDTIRRSAASASDRSHTITVTHTPGAPTAIDTALDERRAVEAVLALPQLEHLDDFDAICIACFGDPGLEVLRTLTSKPVIGMAQAAMTFEATAYGSFGIVAASQDAVPIMERLVASYGLGPWCRGVTAVGVGVGELSANPDRHLPVIEERCGDLIRDHGAASICLGCSALGPAGSQLSARFGRPVLDAVPLALSVATTAARL